ncbi:lipopolysaccharide biosynthesis protein [Sinomicrobium kalidii]|uniref:lipopolysaccharide biosynthesis protein n=1 Tax=Sinomicrobium kalidii TaxID=2900738 RepID=UPI001E450652|nr:lipopolysaccharide biosynthesis protein [Sinomicrobium kalidii]UGU14371.1 lipopolysaccharide biosynthesis protein [Sinomicrobium kalidii]
MTSLKSKTINGIFWSLLQNIGGKGIQFIVMLLLARLLTPEAFGLIGMLMIFIQVSQALIIAGFNQALIQKKDTDEEDYSSVFWVNLGVSVLIYVILFFAAPYIATFYDQPVLTELVRALSLVFVINAFSYVQEARLSKEMRFKTLTIISIPSTVIGGVASIVIAIMGFGVWSIIALQLITRFAYAIQIWFYSRWMPLLTYNGGKVKKLFSFGSNLMVSTIIHTVYKNVYLVVIGKFFPLSALGYYQNANNLVIIPSSTISGALAKVTFPAFSSIQDDDKRLKEGFKKIIQQVLFWICPAFVLAAVMAVPLFRFVFTEKWLPAVPYFRILCITGVIYPLSTYNLAIVNVKGRSDLFLKLEIIKKAIVIVGLIIIIPFGIYPLLIFQAVSTILMYVFNSYYSGKFIQYPTLNQLKDIMPILLLNAIVGVIVFCFDYNFAALSDILRLFVGLGIGGGLYWMGAKFFKFEPYLEFVHIIKPKRIK